MPDFLSKSERSDRMASIRSKNTGLEHLFFSTIGSSIHQLGFRYRKHYENLPGKPDAAFPAHKLAVFVDSSFWHGRNFERLRHKLSKSYWSHKIQGNVKRDAWVNARLRAKGWRIVRIWDTDLEQRPAFCERRILAKLTRSKAMLSSAWTLN